MLEHSFLREKTTGIPALIWVSAKNANHGARVKVQWGDSIKDSVSVSIHKTNPTVVAGNEKNIDSEILNRTREWIISNYETLMQYWNMEIDTAELISNLHKLR